ncbi:DNA-binding response regulator [Reticulibacter mediterranei]|uniref:DNA-binding response regulator n=1 Tax=Reticulibacter mediterranei TaxID=2778369 RepID=A0A8J3IQ20_9CHLR|nr:response regulator transcription factor [Reticulibacter mediterranei]GHO98088.1 DNA-binding response regulator [Reticulibacter mediterranei]
MKRIRLIIADDHPVVRAGLQGMLASQPDFEIVGEATNGAEAVALVVALQPDLVLMDLRMATMDGVAATAQIRRQLPTLPVLVLTTYDSDSDILRAIEAGATGYLLKDAPRDQLFSAIRDVAQGKSALAPTVMTRLQTRLHSSGGDGLSVRELEVLTHVARGSSNKQIARHLHISEATVKSHLIHIFSKLGVTDRTAAVMVALERGLLSMETDRE